MADDHKSAAGNWDEEVIDALNSDFPDWRNPSRTYMVPYEFSYRTRQPDTGEQAEKKFFELLKEFGERRSEEMFVIHSYVFAQMISESKNGKAEKFWLKGEHDFVVLHKEKGIIFFQVKAADKRNKKKKFSEGKKQLGKDGQSLQVFVEGNVQGIMKKDINQELHTQEGFVMPNYMHPKNSVVNSPNGEDCENVKAFSEANEQLLQTIQSLQGHVVKKEKGKRRKETNREFHKYPGFVVMPNCLRPDDSVVNPPNGVFKEDCENVEAFSAWWDKNVKREMFIREELFQFLVMRFVGMAQPRICRHLCDSIKWNKRQLDRCMEEGLKPLLDTPKEQWISGPCGSGPRWLLAKKVEELLQEKDKNILIVCSSKPLSIKLAKEFDSVKVETFEDLLLELSEHESCFKQRRKELQVSEVLKRLEKGTVSVQRYRHIFVYQCEDLYGDWPALFKKLLKDDEREYGTQYLWFFFDPNQNLSTEYREHLQFLKRGTRLFKVSGNPEIIFHQVMKYFKTAVSSAKLPIAGDTPCGPQIEWNDSLSSRDDEVDAGAKLIEKYIKDFRRNKVMDKEVCILTENEEVRNSVISELEKIQVQCQNSTDCYKNGENKVVVESIRQFKGLDSNVVVLYNPPYACCTSTKTEEHVKSLLYLAVSSCVCKLVVITTECGCKALKSKEGVIKNNSEAMEHIVKHHMLPVKFRRSYFLSPDLTYISNIVTQTLSSPDQMSSRWVDGGKVYKKFFPEQTGIHGLTGKPCYGVTCVVDTNENKLITSFPTLK